jgi:predicted nucleic acid-binding Zn ribbon protein
MAGPVKCLYCGGEVPEERSHCPHCGAVSHFQQRGYRAGVRRRFILFLVALAILSVVAILWLPR